MSLFAVDSPSALATSENPPLQKLPLLGGEVVAFHDGSTMSDGAPSPRSIESELVRNSRLMAEDYAPDSIKAMPTKRAMAAV